MVEEGVGVEVDMALGGEAEGTDSLGKKMKVETSKKMHKKV